MATDESVQGNVSHSVVSTLEATPTEPPEPDNGGGWVCTHCTYRNVLLAATCYCCDSLCPVSERDENLPSSPDALTGNRGTIPRLSQHGDSAQVPQPGGKVPPPPPPPSLRTRPRRTPAPPGKRHRYAIPSSVQEEAAELFNTHAAPVHALQSYTSALCPQPPSVDNPVPSTTRAPQRSVEAEPEAASSSSQPRNRPEPPSRAVPNTNEEGSGTDPSHRFPSDHG